MPTRSPRARALRRTAELNQHIGGRRLRLHRDVTDAMGGFDALTDALTHVDAMKARSEHDVDGDRIEAVGNALGV